MSRSAVFSPRAVRDLERAVDWYRSISPALARRFIDEVERTIAAACESPTAFAVVDEPIRRVNCRRFPYRVFFMVEESQIVVLAVYHVSRDPQRWRDDERE